MTSGELPPLSVRIVRIGLTCRSYLGAVRSLTRNQLEQWRALNIDGLTYLLGRQAIATNVIQKIHVDVIEQQGTDGLWVNIRADMASGLHLANKVADLIRQAIVQDDVSAGEL